MIMHDSKLLGMFRHTQQDAFGIVRRDYVESFKPYFELIVNLHPAINMQIIELMQTYVNNFINKHSLPIRVNVVACGTVITIIGADWVSECVWEAIAKNGTSVNTKHS